MGNFFSRCGGGLKSDLVVPAAESIQEPAQINNINNPTNQLIDEPAQMHNPTNHLFDEWDASLFNGNISGTLASWFSIASANLSTRITRALGKRKKDSNPAENSILEDKSYIESQLLMLEQQVDCSLILFSFPALRLATNSFTRHKLGVGGFGNVYKGYFENLMAEKISKMLGQAKEKLAIAVKKLETVTKQGFKQWLTEIITLGGLSHPNIVKLLGYCHESNQNFLIVYEFMDKGSLNYYLFRRFSLFADDSKHMLTWKSRLNIMIGMARGLSYLHSLEDPIIHRDFKSSNILLATGCNAKISDFGLAKRRSTLQTEEDGIMGTRGYAAPEYVESGKLDIKSDVYGFGVVLIEMLTGLRATDKKRPVEQQNLLDWIRPKLLNRVQLRSTMDCRLEGKYAFKEAHEIALLALRCVSSYDSRPSMMEAVDILERIGASYRIT